MILLQIYTFQLSFGYFLNQSNLLYQLLNGIFCDQFLQIIIYLLIIKADIYHL